MAFCQSDVSIIQMSGIIQTLMERATMLASYLAHPAQKVTTGTPTNSGELKSKFSQLVDIKTYFVVDALIRDARHLLRVKPLIIFSSIPSSIR